MRNYITLLPIRHSTTVSTTGPLCYNICSWQQFWTSAQTRNCGSFCCDIKVFKQKCGVDTERTCFMRTGGSVGLHTVFYCS